MGHRRQRTCPIAVCPQRRTQSDLEHPGVCTGRRARRPAFDTIWSNPPIRIGKHELHALLLRWLSRLTPAGRRRWSSRSTSARTRCSAGWSSRACPPSASPPRPATACSSPVRSPDPRRDERTGRLSDRSLIACTDLQRDERTGRLGPFAHHLGVRRGRGRPRCGSSSRVGVRWRSGARRGPSSRRRARGADSTPRPTSSPPAASASTNSPEPAPDTRASAPNGGSDNMLPADAFALGDDRRVAGDGGAEHLVIGRERLDQHLGCDAARSRDQRDRVLGGAEPRGEHLGVELEEGHDVGVADAVQHGLGADVDVDPVGRLARRPRDRQPPDGSPHPPAPRADASTPGRRLAKAEWPHCWHTGGRSVPHRRQCRRPSSSRPTAASHRSHRCNARQLRQASTRARPVMFDTHTMRRPGVRSRSISGDVTSERFHGSSSDRSTTVTAGQPARSRARGRMDDAARAGVVHDGGQRRRRRHQHERHPGPSTAFDQHVAGVPCRRSLLLQRLVVLVDDAPPPRARRTAPTPPIATRSPRRRRHVPPPSRSGTVATVSPARASRIASSATWLCAGATTSTDPDRRRANVDRRQQGRHHVGPRREPQHTAHRATARAWRSSPARSGRGPASVERDGRGACRRPPARAKR